LLVQDNINQPVFLFINSSGIPEARITQTFDEWHITFTDATNVTVATNGDQREYVPIGNSMAWDDGTLYIVSQDKTKIYRSVSGRPLDFVVNVKNTLSDGTTVPQFTQYGGGNADTTAYSVGVNNITCIRSMSAGGIFVSAGGACFSVIKNKTQNAPTQFGEYTFIRTFLFNAPCLSDRVIFDSLGDTKFISLTGVRSFNSIKQTHNEGQNTAFTAQIQNVFGDEETPIIQSESKSAAILFNDYELYAVNTIFGYAILKYDTINKCWTSVDLQQTDGKAIKKFTKIELSLRRLYALTEDDMLYELYIGPSMTTPSFRTIGVCANVIYENSVEAALILIQNTVETRQQQR